jgi:ribosomal protein S2
MKINKYNNKLVQLQILKLYYQKNNSKTSLKQIEVHLNKISNIIYKYHITNKKILFVGFPKSFSAVLKDTKHLSIPESVWFNGMLTNRTINSSSPQNFTKKQMRLPVNVHQLLLRLRKKLDLVIVYNLGSKATAVEESYINRIPVITISKGLDILDSNATYKAPGDYSFVDEKRANNNVFYSIIQTTLSRAITTKKVKSLKFRSINYDFFQKKTKKNLFSKQRRSKHSKSFQNPSTLKERGTSKKM